MQVFQTRPPQAVLKVNQVALAAALQKAGCGTAATVRSLDEELIALIISSRAELQVFLTALGLNHLAVADWKLVATGTFPCRAQQIPRHPKTYIIEYTLYPTPNTITYTLYLIVCTLQWTRILPRIHIHPSPRLFF